ncbi:MAG: PAS domain S-box protein, partial [bacterium]|nr:PAS domain S-box protein [bacterium]
TGITVRNLTIPLFEGSLLKKIIDERTTAVLHDMEHVVRDFSDKKKLKVLAQEVTKIAGLKTGIRVPLIAGDDVFGVIGAGMNRSVVDDTDIKSLERFASHAALIIKKARAEEEVRESEKKFRNFMDTAGDLMFIADADRNFTYVNQSMAATLGYSANEMMGMNVTKILTEESIKKSLDNEKKIEELIKTGMLADKNTWITKDNKVIFGEVKLLAILNANHNLQEVRGVFRDYTEKKSLEEQLRQSHKLEGIGQLAGGIAHDFNNILTVINGFAEMSATELDDNSDVAQFIKQIVKSSKKAEILVRQLLAFSRKQIMRPRVLNINKNIAE